MFLDINKAALAKAKAGLKNKEIAERTKLTSETIARAFRGVSVSAITCIKIAKALSVNLTDIVLCEEE